MLLKYGSVSLCLFIWFSTPTVTAQESAAEISIETDDQDQTIEEITVIGMRDITSLDRQVIEARNRIYELFNELNTDDLYDVHCRMIAPTGSRIKKRQCLPNFYNKATTDAAQGWLSGEVTGNYGGVIPVNAVLDYHYPILKEKMKEKVLENRDLFDRFVELAELEEKLEEKRNIYWGREQE